MRAKEGSDGDGEVGRLGPALLLTLLVISVAAGILVYRARTPDLALEVTEITRNFDLGESETAGFTFFVRFDEPDATVSIIGRNLEPVRTLLDGVELRADARLSCEWDGTDDQGEPAPNGRYRLRVELPSEDRDMVYPRRIDVVGQPPKGSDRREILLIDDPCEEEE